MSRGNKMQKTKERKMKSRRRNSQKRKKKEKKKKNRARNHNIDNDNKITGHSHEIQQSYDFSERVKRHGVRLAPRGSVINR
jgi:uncharacterized protein YaiL (DUF2058 family)